MGRMHQARAEFEGVTVRRGELAVLDQLSLSLPLGERTVILGANGAGKTTLLLALHGLLAPSAGSIRFVSPQGRIAPPSLGYVLQKPVMLRRSALGNVEHALALTGAPAGARRERAIAALESVGLGYATHRAARRLSGGEQQRVALARARALLPDCLLLDEPTASLDPASAVLIERELMRLADEGVGLVMSTHDLALARRIATRVVFLHRGQVLETGEAAGCFADPRDATLRRFLAGQWLA